MDFLKRSAGSLSALFLLVVYWIWDQLSGQVFSEWVFSLVPSGRREMLGNILVGIAISYLSFRIGMNWHLHGTAIEKVERFLKIKLKQGKKILKSKMDSRVTKPKPGAVPDKEGWVVLDSDQTNDFRHCYGNWIRDLHAGLVHAFGEKKIKEEFDEGLPISASFNTVADMRPDLEKDLNYLRKKIDGLKKDQLVINFNPEFLDDYKGDPCR